MSEKDGAVKGIFGLSMVAILLVISFFLFFAFQGRHAHGQERKSEPASKSEMIPRSQLGIPLPRGCVSHPCGYHNGRLKSGIAEVVECPIGVEPPAHMDF